MAIIKNEDIVGFYVDAELVCEGCITDEEVADVKLDDIIEKINDDEWAFCDRCKMALVR